jgi:1-acyl-sn-glycerol-3-phosphate acyltransferase
MWRLSVTLFKPVVHAAYGVYFWVVFGNCALATLILLILLPQQSTRRRAARGAAGLVFRLTGSWPDIAGREHLPARPNVVVANHASYLDGILLTAVLPHEYQFVIKREMTRLPLIHFFLRRLGAHFVERFDKHRGATDARKIMATAGSGASLAFFPEGTFHSEAGLRHFHSGAFIIAARNLMPVVPLAIHGTRTMLPAHRVLPRPTRLRVTIVPALNRGEPITDPRAALVESRRRILEHLDESDLLAIE